MICKEENEKEMGVWSLFMDFITSVLPHMRRAGGWLGRPGNVRE